MFLEDEGQTSLDDLNEMYVLVNFRPAVTNRNWRMDCGVAGYDNTFGLPPFFPTRLRFEDYIYRLWIQQEGIVAAHVDAAQNHTKSNYMRNPPASEIFNEEVCNLLKRKIKATVTHLDALSIEFDYDGEVTGADAAEILEKSTSGPTSKRPCCGSTGTATAMETGSSNTTAVQTAVCCTRAGRIPTMRSFTRMARSRAVRSPCARYRATRTRHGGPVRPWRWRSRCRSKQRSSTPARIC